MALHLYDQKEVLNIVQAIYVSGESSSAMILEVLREVELVAPGEEGDRLLEAYRTGVRATVGAFALAFGLVPAQEGKAPWRLPDGR